MKTISAKDSLILELTTKLKESTKVIQSVKQSNAKLKEDLASAANDRFINKEESHLLNEQN